MEQIIIGICAIVALAAILANYLPSIARKEDAARRLNAIVSVGRGDHLRRAASHDKFLQSLSAYTVNKLQLQNHLSTKDYKEKLFRAGFRTESAETTFLFARFCCPIVLALIALVYMYGIEIVSWHPALKAMTVVFAALLGLKLPDIIIMNAMQKRNAEISKIWPDALDLLVICVESGMTVELAFRAVARDIAPQSKSFASELNYMIAELSHLPNRAEAYKNFAQRIPIPSIQATSTALIQADAVGTPIADTLRTMADESRTERKQVAKKKAASLGPKMTLPIVFFFVPSLITIIIGPALISAFGWK